MNKPTLTKTCTVCGLQKPLSAFLQLGGPRAIYGTICSTCRKTAMEKRLPKDTEGSTTSTSGHRVGTKEKVAGDLHKEQERDKLKELYREESEKDAKTETDSQNIREKTKEHDKRKLEKGSFLSTPRKPIEIKTAQQAQQVEQNIQKAEATKQERQQKGIDFSGPFEGTRVAGQQRFQSAVFRQFATWIGSNSPIGKTMGEAVSRQNKTDTEKPAKDASGNPLTDYIKNEWKPKSGR